MTIFESGNDFFGKSLTYDTRKDNKIEEYLKETLDGDLIFVFIIINFCIIIFVYFSYNYSRIFVVFPIIFVFLI